MSPNLPSRKSVPKSVQFGLLVRRQQKVERGVGIRLDADNLALRRADCSRLRVMAAVVFALMAVESAVSAVVIWVSRE